MPSSKRRRMGAVLIVVGVVLGALVAGSGYIDGPASRMAAFLAIFVAISLVAAGAGMRHDQGPTS